MSQATATETPRVGIAQAPARHRRDLRRLLRPILMLGGIVVVVAGSLAFWITGGRYVSIDDAYVRAAKESLSTDVSGIVMSVPVHEGQLVHKGEVLLKLDPAPFQIAVDGARANLGGVVSSLNAMKLDYKRMVQDIAVKQSQVGMDQVNNDRFASLVQGGGELLPPLPLPPLTSVPTFTLRAVMTPSKGATTFSYDVRSSRRCTADADASTIAFFAFKSPTFSSVSCFETD